MPQMLECQIHPTQQHHLLRLRHRQVHCPLINAISSAVLPIATICVQLHVTMATTDASSTGGTEPNMRHCFALYAGEADQEQLNFDSTLVLGGKETPMFLQQPELPKLNWEFRQPKLDLVSDLFKLPAFCMRFYWQKDWRLEETLICATGTIVSEDVLQQSPNDFFAEAVATLAKGSADHTTFTEWALRTDGGQQLNVANGMLVHASWCYETVGQMLLLVRLSFQHRDSWYVW